MKYEVTTSHMPTAEAVKVPLNNIAALILLMQSDTYAIMQGTHKVTGKTEYFICTLNVIDEATMQAVCLPIGIVRSAGEILDSYSLDGAKSITKTVAEDVLKEHQICPHDVVEAFVKSPKDAS
jgi:hypothetical protein